MSEEEGCAVPESVEGCVLTQRTARVAVAWDDKVRQEVEADVETELTWGEEGVLIVPERFRLPTSVLLEPGWRIRVPGAALLYGWIESKDGGAVLLRGNIDGVSFDEYRALHGWLGDAVAMRGERYSLRIQSGGHWLAVFIDLRDRGAPKA